MDIRRFGPAYALPVVHPRPHGRDLRDLLRHRLPGPAAAERAAAARLAGVRLARRRTAPSSARRRAGSASSTTPTICPPTRHARCGVSTTERLRPRGWAGRDWSPSAVVEHLATRARPACSTRRPSPRSTSPGPDAAAFLERVCDNHVARGVGDVTYTQCLNERGGIEMDVTVTRLGADRFRVVTGTAYGTHDLGHLRRQARLLDADVGLADVSGSEVCFALWGPAARDVLAGLTPADLSDRAFPFMTAQDLPVGDVPVRALRVTFVGELGWELYAPASTGCGCGRPCWTPAATAVSSRRVPRDREPPAGEGLPGLEHRHHPRDEPLRGRPGLLRQARQARRLRRRRGAAPGEGGGDAPAPRLPGARRSPAGGARR